MTQSTTNSPPPRIWALIDNRPGTATQALGVAEKLGLPFESKHISYTPMAALPNALRGATLIGVDRKRSSPLSLPRERGRGGVGKDESAAPPLTLPPQGGEKNAGYPDIVISAGRRTAPVALYLKRKNPAAKIVQIMRPGLPLEAFDLVVIPAHDEPTAAANIFSTALTPHRLTRAMLAQASAQWQDAFRTYPSPRVAVLIGGDSKGAKFSGEDYRALFKRAEQLTGATGSLLITTSKRTPKQVVDAIPQLVTRPYYLYAYGEGKNPYLGMLTQAEAIIVTGDSMSMCSEACFAGKPLYIFQPKIMADKYRRMHQVLFNARIAERLDDNVAHIFSVAPVAEIEIDSAQVIADYLRGQLAAG